MEYSNSKIDLGQIIKVGVFLTALLLFSTGHSIAGGNEPEPNKTALQDCLLKALETAPGDMTINELRARCRDQQMAAAEKKEEAKSVVDARIYTDDQNILRPFTLMAHRPNYILLAAYNPNPNNEPYREAFDDPSIELDDVESQFQVSIKMPLAIDLFKNKVDIFAAFTMRAFWQVYNSDISAPFRETNYEPEAWVQFRPDWSLWGFKNAVNLLGFNHQSNGRSEPLSRSWNRIFANFVFERENLVLSINPWYRIEEGDDDDNPDITDYMGHFDLLAAYKWREHTFSILSRNNLESGFSRGAVEATWSFPLWDYKYLKGYIQGFTGYGQSLIDYNVHQQSIGIGFAITDYL
jgi:phospholipase A1